MKLVIIVGVVLVFLAGVVFYTTRETNESSSSATGSSNTSNDVSGSPDVSDVGGMGNGDETSSDATTQHTDEPIVIDETSSVSPTSSVVVVSYNGSSFLPKTVTISAGDTVRFVNSGGNMWVASNNHPTHTNYPEKSSGDCSGSSFDQCGVGSVYEFIFNSIGSHRYHNHVRASQGGTIIVQ